MIIGGGLTTTRLVAGALACAALILGLSNASPVEADAPGASIAFQLKASNGNSIFGIAFSRRADGRGNVTLFVGKKGAVVTYFAPATVLASEVRTPSVFHPPSVVRADLGGLGRIDLEFVPSGVVKREHSTCDKTAVGVEAGSYQGAFEFHGEEGYAAASATSVPASVAPLLNLVCGTPVGGETGGSNVPGARLRLFSKSNGRTVKIQANKNRPGAAMIYEATIKERSGPIRIQRTIEGRAPAASLVPSNGLRIASFEPPPPFDGRAVFRRNASLANRWTGDLSVDFPGESDVPLTGAFEATLIPAELLEGGR